MTEKFSLEERVDYLKEHGSHCMAYSTLQPGMRYFDLNGVGYLGYMEKWGTRFVLGNPVSGKNNYEKIIGEALKEHKDTCFVQTSKDCAEVLKDFGYYNTQMGIETVVPIEEWNLNGKDKTHLRRWVNSAKNAGFTISERGVSDYLGELNDISDSWRNSRANKKKMQFLVRDPGVEDSLFGSRLFCAYCNDSMGAFTIFSPMYEKNKVFGYYADISRIRSDSPNGVPDLILSEAIKKFDKEGCSLLSLGLSPLSNLSNSSNSNFVTLNLFSFFYDHFNFLYNFKGVDFHKSKYPGKKNKTFFSSTKRYQYLDLLKGFKLFNVL